MFNLNLFNPDMNTHEADINPYGIDPNIRTNETAVTALLRTHESTRDIYQSNRTATHESTHDIDLSTRSHEANISQLGTMTANNKLSVAATPNTNLTDTETIDKRKEAARVAGLASGEKRRRNRLRVAQGLSPEPPKKRTKEKVLEEVLNLAPSSSKSVPPLSSKPVPSLTSPATSLNAANTMRTTAGATNTTNAPNAMRTSESTKPTGPMSVSIDGMKLISKEGLVIGKFYSLGMMERLEKEAEARAREKLWPELLEAAKEEIRKEERQLKDWKVVEAFQRLKERMDMEEIGRMMDAKPPKE